MENLTYATEDETATQVYFISDITPEALVQAYDALNWSPTGKVGVKLSTGEPPASNESRNGMHTLENAEAIGLGSRSYQLIDLD